MDNDLSELSLSRNFTGYFLSNIYTAFVFLCWIKIDQPEWDLWKDQ